MAKDELVFRFNEKYEKHLDYEDKLPEGVTEEDVQAEFGKLVWCDFYDCFWNKRVDNLQRTWGTITNQPAYEPIGSNPTDAVFQGICSKPNEIALRFRTIRTTTGMSQDVPYCFVAAKNGKLGHMDFSKLLQPNMTPYGGNIDSQSGDQSYTNETFHA